MQSPLCNYCFLTIQGLLTSQSIKFLDSLYWPANFEYMGTLDWSNVISLEGEAGSLSYQQCMDNAKYAVTMARKIGISSIMSLSPIV